MRSVSFTAALVLLLAVATEPAGAQQGPQSVVQVAEVSRTELTPTVPVPGTVFSRNELQVTAGIAGRLEWVAEPGTRLAAGAVIARLDREALELQRAEQVALLERAEISLRQLESQLRRQRELANEKLVSEFELEQTEANRDLARSDTQISRVRIRQIEEQIARADVRAPFAGVVISRLRRAGEEVARGEVLGQMTDTQNLEVRAFVPLKHLPRTVVGGSLSVFAAETEYPGRIRALVPTGDVRSQTFEAHIDLPQEAVERWTVGQLVSVAVPVRNPEMSLAVPRDALVLRASGVYVFRINSEDKAERVAVQTGDSSGSLIAVSGELWEGDRVAVRGAENLREGAEVKIMLSQRGAGTAAGDS
ncbi:MAG: efflux RND transporter periplasmic adaptor subunit [Pseudomonadota bacterium]